VTRKYVAFVEDQVISLEETINVLEQEDALVAVIAFQQEQIIKQAKRINAAQRIVDDLHEEIEAYRADGETHLATIETAKALNESLLKEVGIMASWKVTGHIPHLDSLADLGDFTPHEDLEAEFGEEEIAEAGRNGW
jgi:hypothetical protein